MVVFAPENFRSLPSDFSLNLRTAREVTLILVKAGGAASFGKSRADKDALIARYEQQDLLLMAWTGNYSTDIFLLDKAAVLRFYS